jgi:hypothetical protein
MLWAIKILDKQVFNGCLVYSTISVFKDRIVECTINVQVDAGAGRVGAITIVPVVCNTTVPTVTISN